MQPAVFLDRDNTLIANDGDLGDPEAVRLLDGVPEGLVALREAGYCLVVVTNQSGVARGRFTEADVDAVHQRIARLVDERGHGSHLIDRFYYCPYHPEAALDEYRREHPWRKPNPGMLLQAARDMGIDLGSSWMVGDQSRDIAAGQSAGCRTVLFNGNGRIDESDEEDALAVVSTFREVVEHILATPGEADSSDETEPADDAGVPAVGLAGQDDSTEPRSPVAARVGPAARLHPLPGSGSNRSSDDDRLHRAIMDLSEELRTDRMRRAEFTPLKMAAGFCQLLVVLLALLGMIQMDSTVVFLQWMAGAMLAQLLTLTLLVLDLKA